MTTTVVVMIDVELISTHETVTQEARIRVDRISGTVPDRCTKDDSGNILMEGLNIFVRKGFNNAYRAFRNYNDVRSIAPFN